MIKIIDYLVVDFARMSTPLNECMTGVFHFQSNRNFHTPGIDTR